MVNKFALLFSGAVRHHRGCHRRDNRRRRHHDHRHGCHRRARPGRRRDYRRRHRRVRRGRAPGLLQRSSLPGRPGVKDGSCHRRSMLVTITVISSPTLDHIFDLLDPFGVELGDVDHAVDVGQDLDESAEIGDAHHLAGVDAAQSGAFRSAFRSARGLPSRLLYRSRR